jgi:glycosyltransferase involved in cell wall biosynthesis
VKRATRRLKVCVVNSYLKGREADVEKGLYPRSHLWGADALQRAGHDVVIVPSEGAGWFAGLLRRLSRLTRHRLGDLEQEWLLLRHLRGADVVYVPNGVLFSVVWLRWLRLIRAKICVWVYVPFARDTGLRRLMKNRLFLRGHDGFLCLTEKAARSYAAAAPHAHVRCIPWAADTDMFRPAREREPGDFFFTCGRTNRDYRTLFTAAQQVNFPIRALVSPWYLRDITVPPNVSLIRGPDDPSHDGGISYPQLVADYYCRARAVLISRLAHPDDTNGFTNILEALGVGKPIIMTRTGSLDIDIEKEGVGIHVEPGDTAGWVRAMQKLVDEPALALEMGRRARRLAENYYNLDRFGRDLVSYFQELP